MHKMIPDFPREFLDEIPAAFGVHPNEQLSREDFPDYFILPDDEAGPKPRDKKKKEK